MKFTLPFVSLMLVGLLGSLHTPSTDPSTSIGARQDAQVQDSLKIVDGTIEALYPETHTVAIKTDRGRVVVLQLYDFRKFALLQAGTRVRVKIGWNEAGWPNRFSSPESHSQI
jgi:hypothetical protein